MIKMVMVSLTLKVTDNTASNTKKLPKAEAITKLQGPNKNPPNVPPKTPAPNINRATPKLAPLLNPKTKGPAKGFLNNVCMMSPETAKPPPVKIAVIAFGKRYSKIINCHEVLVASPPNKLENTSLIGIETLPKLILITNVITNKSIRIIKWDRYVF